MVGRLNPIVARALGATAGEDEDERSMLSQFTDLRSAARPTMSPLGNQFGSVGVPNVETLGMPQELLDQYHQLGLGRVARSGMQDAASRLRAGIAGAARSALTNLSGLGGKFGKISGGAGAGGVDIDRILATIRQLESGGNYTARNPHSTASGAYQFINSTWGGYGGYSTAAAAPKHVQDAKARQDVLRFLAANNNNIHAVPGMWYSPAVWQSGNLNRNPGGPGNPLTVQQYIDRWMRTYNSL